LLLFEEFGSLANLIRTLIVVI